MNTQIVLVSVDNNNARKVCEQIEDFVYPTLTALKDTLTEKLGRNDKINLDISKIVIIFVSY
jgi:hypothetical protein